MYLCKFTIAVALIALLTVALHLYFDYLSFKALGPGGTPSTVYGFVKVKLLSVLAVRKPFESREILDENALQYLTTLPPRTRVRPITRGIAPHRQISLKATDAMVQALARSIGEMRSELENIVSGVSCIEGYGIALFSKSPSKQNEICHLHSSDGSMHVVLAPADSKVVLEAGWGERHPLSHGGFFERFVPTDFVMVYAPLEDEELAIVLQIIKAAA